MPTAELAKPLLQQGLSGGILFLAVILAMIVSELVKVKIGKNGTRTRETCRFDEKENNAIHVELKSNAEMLRASTRLDERLILVIERQTILLELMNERTTDIKRSVGEIHARLDKP